jgi:hypothetical protein
MREECIGFKFEKEPEKANARTSIKRSTGGVAALPRTAHFAKVRKFLPNVKES